MGVSAGCCCHGNPPPHAQGVSHLVSGCQEPGVILEGLLDQAAEAVEQGEQLLYVLLGILKAADCSQVVHAGLGNLTNAG